MKNKKKASKSIAQKSVSGHPSKIDTKKLQDLINEAFGAENISPKQSMAVLTTMKLLDSGALRVATPVGGATNPAGSASASTNWQINEWVKKAILLYFKLQKMKPMNAGALSFYDKIPLKKWTGKEGVRVVPHAIARYGSFLEAGTIMMPSFVNIGAYVGAGTMVDTWATVGSCAQIGKNCHLSGGVGIGGVLEPLQASPVIIEDHCFLGSRAIVVEGVIVRAGAVLGAGVTLTSSTKIIDVTGSKPVEYKGEVPANSVVIPGTSAKKFPAGEYGVPCALIIGQRKESTDKKTSLNNVLRDYNVSI